MSYNSDMSYHYLNKCKLLFAKQTDNSLPSCLLVLRKCAAFTLAETLITLGIIGVVAAMTIPVLVSNYKEKAAVTQLRKTYSILNQALKIAESKNDTPDAWGMTNDIDGVIKLGDILSKELNLSKNCKTDTGCWPDVTYKYLNNNDLFNVNTYETFYKVIMSDGTLLRFSVTNPDCSLNYGPGALKNTCGIIGVDINGFKKPNKVGEDYFNFWITKEAVVPAGMPGNTVHAFQAQCKNKSTHTGYACTAWVIYNENMDYLHCNDLSWDGKRKCN